MGKREREYDPARTLRRMRNFVVAVLLAVLACVSVNTFFTISANVSSPIAPP